MFFYLQINVLTSMLSGNNNNNKTTICKAP